MLLPVSHRLDVTGMVWAGIQLLFFEEAHTVLCIYFFLILYKNSGATHWWFSCCRTVLTRATDFSAFYFALPASRLGAHQKLGFSPLSHLGRVRVVLSCLPELSHNKHAIWQCVLQLQELGGWTLRKRKGARGVFWDICLATISNFEDSHTSKCHKHLSAYTLIPLQRVYSRVWSAICPRLMTKQ